MFPHIARLFRGRTTPKARRVRLAVRPLEDRAVPANFTAANVAELIAAIDAANLSPEADTVTLVTAKKFTLTAANNTTHGPTGLPTIAAVGGPLTVVGNGAIIARSLTKETLPFRLVDVEAGANLTLRDLTLQGGWAFGFGVEAQGGAIYSLGELTLDGVTVSKNLAEGRGAATGQTAGSAAGGGVYSNGALSIVGSRIESNTAIGGAGADGRNLVSVIDQPTITLAATRGGDGCGGGIYVASGTAAISSTTIVANTATGGDGGDGIIGYSPAGQFVSPAAPGGNGRGGGLFVGSGAAALRTVTTTSNRARGGSAGVGVPGAPDGASGVGIGGGIFFAPGAAPDLDAFTFTHARRNKASTADPDISGP